MAEDIVLTPGGKKKIEEELVRLRNEEMPALSERIRQARALGDLSENFDYQDAKRQQGFVAGKIADLQAVLDRARIEEEVGPGSEVVGMGSTVTVRDLDFGDEFSYTLVGVYEADPANDKISTISPVGKALMNRKVGDRVEIDTPAGKTAYEIVGSLNGAWTGDCCGDHRKAGSKFCVVCRPTRLLARLLPCGRERGSRRVPGSQFSLNGFRHGQALARRNGDSGVARGQLLAFSQWAHVDKRAWVADLLPGVQNREHQPGMALPAKFLTLSGRIRRRRIGRGLVRCGCGSGTSRSGCRGPRRRPARLTEGSHA
jgi:transcription elongation factor GreA